MSIKDEYLDKYYNKSLKEMHNDAYNSLDREDNFNYGEDLIKWQPVVRDLEFEKHIAKLKAMKRFNERD